jgi:hypothetical protein
MSIKFGSKVRPQAGLLTPVSRSTPVFQSRIVDRLSTNTTPSCMLSISFFSNNDGVIGRRFRSLVLNDVPGHRVPFFRQTMEPATGQFFGEQVLVLRKYRLELADQIGIGWVPANSNSSASARSRDLAGR